ncbi:alcohol dehydrogenase zinc-binding domain-containing protein [Lichtheimia corymbifera JMRC:FSU:9682]|uniref:Alcohol dehydrogenase zinc-binding domain-containing protein n=1 Tax=Lichtheimia corymbifera JMRC:FSU:9682 TaxID=1263082 RepID=A0A068RV81_9FUNG|nr:alcohol dehydrogenase zinc-binding domain-containing protein [Lichtheimia corymbifera JMRC:FSU:9682]
METTIPESMNALQLIRTGPAESCMEYTKVPTPSLTRKDDILVRIKATGINPVEAKFRAGNVGYFPLSFPCIFGCDYAGIVAAVGSSVTDFQVGDAVYGSLQYPFGSAGTYAEYTIVSSTKDAIVKMPDTISFEEAAATGIAANTAYQGIIVDGNLPKTGHKKILVVGASGGVGTYGIQIAKAIGAETVGVCSGKNAALVKSLGADRVVDYTSEEAIAALARETETFDVILDCVGGDDYYYKLVRTLKKQGVYSTAVGPSMHVGAEKVGLLSGVKMALAVANHKLFGDRNYSVVLNMPWVRFPHDLRPFLENGSVKSVIMKENIFPLKDGAKAHLKLESHRTVGKIVLVM